MKSLKTFGIFVLIFSLAALFAACGGRSNRADGGTDGSDGSDDGGDGGPNTEITIYAIQDVTHADHPDLDSAVIVEGVVVTSPMIKTTSSSTVKDGFFVAEPEGGAYSGIYVYAQGLTVTVAPGDLVNIRGLYAEYFEASQIVATQVDVVGQGTIPDPVVVTPGQVNTTGPDAEMYESVLVQVQDVTVTNDNLGYGDFGVTATGGQAEIIVSPKFDFNYEYDAALNDAFQRLTGILDYSYSEFRIQPRMCADLIDGAGAEVCVQQVCITGEVAIQQIQDRAHSSVVGKGCDVVVEGVIVTTPMIEATSSSTEPDGFWVSEPGGGEYSGIYVFARDVAAPVTVQQGDEVNLIGYYDEYYDSSQLIAAVVTVVGPGTMPTPTVVTPDQVCTPGDAKCASGVDAEKYEGVLVQLQNVVISTPDLGHGDYGVTALGGGDEFYVSPKFDFGYQFSPVQDFQFSELTGVVDYAFEQYRLQPRTCPDMLDSTGAEACQEIVCPETPVTIDRLQNTAAANYVHPNCVVTVEGAVVTSPVLESSGRFYFYAQDPAGGPWSGIYVYVATGGPDTTGIVQGSEISLVGQATEYFGVTEFAPTSITVTGTGVMPAPAVLTPADINDAGALAEAYESVLVQVQDVITVLAVYPGTDGNDHGDWTVATPADQASELIVGWQFYYPFSCPDTGGVPCATDQRAVGKQFTSITGPLGYSYDHFRIQPRADADIVVKPADPADTDGDGYCNPGETSVNCTGEDNCPTDYNDTQADGDSDGVGDVCDICPADSDPDQDDGDTDGVGDACDNCPAAANANQANMDDDELGDVCDPDMDGDGIEQGDGSNPCTGGATADCNDNCPTIDNADQADEDADGVGDLCESGGAHLLMTEISVQPTGFEFVEIHNPTAQAISLDGYYLWDATSPTASYWNIALEPTLDTYDFLVGFPAGASIGPGEYLVVSISTLADIAANATGLTPDYAAHGDGDGTNVLNMTPAYDGAVRATSGLSNGGEVVVLFYWDGASDLVQDVDYLVWGDKVEASDKTGITVGAGTYLADTAVGSQQGLDGHANGESMQRIDLSEGNEVKLGGNGISGHDETSEDVTATWTVAAPTAGAAAQ